MDKHVLLGVCGGIAAYKAVELLRLLKKKGLRVTVIMTQNATQFVSPLTFSALSEEPVLTDTFQTDAEGKITHIETAVSADLLLVVPATANILGKFANGIADDLLSTIFLAVDAPKLIAPAMNHRMFKHPLVQKNIETLKSICVHFVDPVVGDLACGEEGDGKLEDPNIIFSHACALLTEKKDLKGVTVLVTAGPTREYIDSVRFITNASSGKMGYAIADDAARRGADVTLISGPVHITPKTKLNLIQVNSVEEMRNSVFLEGKGIHIIIMTAAVGDIAPVDVSSRKLKKDEIRLLELKKTPDILAESAEKGIGSIRVGFAAETDNIIENAMSKLTAKKLDLVVANDISESGIGFESAMNKVTILGKKGIVLQTEVLPKQEIASLVIDQVAFLLNNPPNLSEQSEYCRIGK